MTSTPIGDQNGPAIRAIRKRSGLSVRKVCDLLKEQQGITIHPNSYRNVETNARGASEGLIAAIARVLKVPTVAILGRPSTADVEVKSA